MIGVGVGLSIPLEDTSDFSLTHVGGKAQLTISYLMTRDIKLFVDGGYAFWMGLDLFDAYNGILAGAGVVIKY